MKKWDILIVEDESLIAEELSRIVQRLGYNVIGIANRYDEAIEIIKEQPPHLILLDIGLDYSTNDGIDLGHYINQNFKIPFLYITANADIYTINRAKITHPTSYILKPFNEHVIFANLEIALYNQKIIETIIVKQGNQTIELDSSKILFIKADNIYCEIHTIENKKYIVRKFLKQIYEELPNTIFIQVHRSYLINKKFIKSYNKEFIMIGDEKIPIGNAYREFNLIL